ncbi:MAG: hypothetical protein RI558_03235 [Psychroflexus sp.]|nr:hypothetical protein [Psychroflexus sp.]
MKKVFCVIFILSLVACNSTKKVKQNLLSGNYYEAIQMAVNQLQKGKSNNKTQEQKLLLQQAFEKYVNKKKDQIKFWEKENVAQNAENIYNAYLDLKNIQNQIKPFLPINHPDKKKPLKFKIDNYSDDILIAQDQYLSVLYNDAQNLINPDNKLNSRDAFYKLKEVINIDPNYKNASILREDAYQLGLEYVFIKAYNDTEKVIPEPLLVDLLDIDTYGLNDFWTVYHRNKESNINYDYDIVIAFKSIIFSPERIIEREESLSGEIEETLYQRNSDGEIIRDENGEKLTYTRTIQGEGRLQTIRQVKSVRVGAQVEYYRLPNDQRMAAYDLNSKYIFDNIYGIYEGDERILTDEQVAMINNRAVPFPSNEQMLLDAGNDIKNQLKQILKRNKIGLSSSP